MKGSMRVLIGGGTGFIGHHLSCMLTNSGYEVLYLSRSAGQNCITWMDLHNKGIPSGITAVVNLAGQLLMDPTKRWNEDFKDIIRSSRVDTTRQLVQAIHSAKVKPKVFVSTSAVGIYPYSDTAVYTEDDAPPPNDFFTHLTHDWEAAAKIPDNSGCRHVTVRIGLALGRDGGVINNIYMPFFFGLGGPLGSGKQWFPWIHVDDVAGIITHALENDHVSGVLNAVAPESASNEQFTKVFASAMWRPAFFPVPLFVLEAIYGKERAEVLTKGQKVIPKRTMELGYEFIYPDLKSACKACTGLLALRNEI